MNQKEILEGCTIPEHIAFIMDGNGRWAKSKGKQRTFGHREGSNTLKQVCKDAYELGVKYVTVYAFSTENWKRPKDEIEFLMKLMKQFLRDSIKEATKNNMKIVVIGKEKGLPDEIIKRIKRLEEATKNNTGLYLSLAINYGSKNEILRAVKALYIDYYESDKDINELSEDDISQYLDTKEVPDPDLMIRTSGEMRVSNYLLWQLAYTEFYFTETYWPDFNKEELIKAILTYNKVERRYGGLV